MSSNPVHVKLINFWYSELNYFVIFEKTFQGHPIGENLHNQVTLIVGGKSDWQVLFGVNKSLRALYIRTCMSDIKMHSPIPSHKMKLHPVF
jgi:hypothetical protein